MGRSVAIVTVDLGTETTMRLAGQTAPFGRGRVVGRMPDELLRRIKFDPQISRSAIATIPWPVGLAPTPQTPPMDPQAPLPSADVLVVTWTVAEAHALSDVFTPGQKATPAPGENVTGWTAYRHNWRSRFRPLVGGAGPSRSKYEDCLAFYSTTTIGALRVVVAKSNLHMCRDGSKLPLVPLWKQMLRETGAGLVITTGTAGGVGANTQLGDVTISKAVQFNCTTSFKNQAFAHTAYPASDVDLTRIVSDTPSLIAANAGQLPAAPRAPVVSATGTVLTTDFFAWDNTTDVPFGLRAYNAAATMVEMGDATLGLAVGQMDDQPRWISVRNASDPQMDGSVPLETQKAEAGSIYDKFGYWTSVNSVIACWAVIASML
jgi:nucleoside phosphorylase